VSGFEDGSIARYLIISPPIAFPHLLFHIFRQKALTNQRRLRQNEPITADFA